MTREDSEKHIAGLLANAKAKTRATSLEELHKLKKEYSAGLLNGRLPLPTTDASLELAGYVNTRIRELEDMALAALTGKKKPELTSVEKLMQIGKLSEKDAKRYIAEKGDPWVKAEEKLQNEHWRIDVSDLTEGSE